jgi:hypothetical protein
MTLAFMEWSTVMTQGTKFLFIASMNVTAEAEPLFNEVCDSERIPSLFKVPGVVSVTWYRSRRFRLSIGGHIESEAGDGLWADTAIYEIEPPDVLTSPRWASAIALLRWPTQVPPHTRDHVHVVLERS